MIVAVLVPVLVVPRTVGQKSSCNEISLSSPTASPHAATLPACALTHHRTELKSVLFAASVTPTRPRLRPHVARCGWLPSGPYRRFTRRNDYLGLDGSAGKQQGPARARETWRLCRSGSALPGLRYSAGLLACRPVGGLPTARAVADPHWRE